MTRTGFWIVSLGFIFVLGGLVGGALYILLLQPAVSGIVVVMVTGIGLLKIRDLDRRRFKPKAGGPDSPRDEMGKVE